MIAYVDASVLLRVALRQPDALTEWPQIEQGVEILLLLARLGLRAGDIVQLRLGNIDWNAAWIHVSWARRSESDPFAARKVIHLRA